MRWPQKHVWWCEKAQTYWSAQRAIWAYHEKQMEKVLSLH